MLHRPYLSCLACLSYVGVIWVIYHTSQLNVLLNRSVNSCASHNGHYLQGYPYVTLSNNDYGNTHFSSQRPFTTNFCLVAGYCTETKVLYFGTPAGGKWESLALFLHYSSYFTVFHSMWWWYVHSGLLQKSSWSSFAIQVSYWSLHLSKPFLSGIISTLRMSFLFLISHFSIDLPSESDFWPVISSLFCTHVLGEHSSITVTMVPEGHIFMSACLIENVVYSFYHTGRVTM